MSQVKCSKCGYVDDESKFPKGLDLLQMSYIAACPKPGCDNRQAPGAASMRMFGGQRPFVFIRDAEPEIPPGSDLGGAMPTVIHRAEEAS